MGERWSDPLVFGDWDPETEGDQDDGGDGPRWFTLAGALAELDGPGYALGGFEGLRARVERASDAVSELTAAMDAPLQPAFGVLGDPPVRAFHAPGHGAAAELALTAQCIRYDELCVSELVPPGQVYVTSEPDMETLELKFNTALMQSMSSEPWIGSRYLTRCVPPVSPHFALITGV